MLFKRTRSQVDAPVELVISIIILLASLSIALLIFGNTSEQQCQSTVKGEIQKIQLAMQDLALQSPPASRKIYLTLPDCGSRSTDLLRFVYFSRPQYCGACPGHFAGCWKLQIASFNKATQTYTSSDEICVDVAGDMVLAQSQNLGCEDLTNAPCPDGGIDCENGLDRVYNINDPTTSISRWSTLETKARSYEITMSKGIANCPNSALGAQCPEISICAQVPNK